MTLTLIELRRDTAANWAVNNPTLASGEPGYETDSKKLKFGDGSTAWSALAYFGTVIASTQQAGGTYTLALADAGTVVEGTSATAQTFTIPPNSSVAFPVGTVIEVFQDGAGQITIAAGAGVTLRSDGGHASTAAQYATIGLRQRAANEWVLSGDLA